MTMSIVPQPPPPSNSPITFVSADNLDDGQITSLVEIEGQYVHAPILEDGLLIVDTGRSILELDPAEIPVLRAVIAAWDTRQEVK
jgi:hypothetical protein